MEHATDTRLRSGDKESDSAERSRRKVDLSKPFIAISGNVATGKSGLVEGLGEAMGLSPRPERWQDNPWFGVSRTQMLASQLWFLVAAATDSAWIATSQAGGIQERCIHEHALVFAPEYLCGDEAKLVADAYSLLDALLVSPQLLVFLHAPPQELARRVRSRGRPQEADMTVQRLTRLDVRYRELIASWTRSPVIEIDTAQCDLRVPENLRAAIVSIERSLA